MRPTNLTSPARTEASLPRSRTLPFWGAALLVIVVDQITKTIVRESLARGESWPAADWPVRIRYVTNTGAAFGILEDQTIFLIVMAFIGLAAIYLYYRYPPFDHFVVPVAIGMMLGGAMGNLLDRVRLGEVTDLVDFPSYPAFNVADSSITIGITIIITGYLLLAPRASPNQKDSAAHEDAGADG